MLVCPCMSVISSAPAPGGHVGVWWVAQSYINSQSAGRQAGREDIDRKGKYSLLVAHHFLCVSYTHIPRTRTASKTSLFACSITQIRQNQKVNTKTKEWRYQNNDGFVTIGTLCKLLEKTTPPCPFIFTCQICEVKQSSITMSKARIITHFCVLFCELFLWVVCQLHHITTQSKNINVVM